MSAWCVFLIFVLALFLGVGPAVPAAAQSGAVTGEQGRVPLYAGMRPADAPWEVSLDARVGFPDGILKSREGKGYATRLRLHDDLGILVSESLEASALFRLTPSDAIRATGLYTFLDGGEFFRKSIVFDGATLAPGHVRTEADFYRLSLAYERVLLSGRGALLSGDVGLTWVHFEPTLRARGRSQSEDFSRDEPPVPIVGLRVDIPMGERFGARAFVAGGGLPRVDRLAQAHADAGFAVTYAFSANGLLHAGFSYSYFLQHERSRRQENTFELTDNGLEFGLSFAF